MTDAPRLPSKLWRSGFPVLMETEYGCPSLWENWKYALYGKISNNQAFQFTSRVTYV